MDDRVAGGEMVTSIGSAGALVMTSATADVARPRVLVFDSGIGGLSVLRELQRILHGADFTYVADDAAFPYGAWQEAALTGHVVELMGRLIATHRPDLVVIACNTASTIVLDDLRAHFSVPFVGTVPAIKPAAAATRSGRISVLATAGTVTREYTRALIERFARGQQVTLVGAARLAGIAEAYLRAEPIDEAEVAAEIAPCFVEDAGARTDTIVLGCTHYPFLIDMFRRLAPWPVQWIDPAPAIARRASDLIGDGAGLPLGPTDARGRAIFTSARPVVAPLKRVLDGFALDC